MRSSKQVERAQIALMSAIKKHNAERARRKIKCSCGALHAINKLTLLVIHKHYDYGYDPHWYESEFQFVCPTSNRRNRFLFDDYDRPYGDRGRAEQQFKDIYRSLFARCLDVWEAETGRGDHWIDATTKEEGYWPSGYEFDNNYYVDQNRERFELEPKLKKSGG